MVVKLPKPPKEEIFRPEEEEEELLPDIEALEQTTALTTAEIQTVVSPDVLAVPPLPVEDIFFSAEEAAQFGADLPIDWQLKVTATGTVSILDPAGWEWLEGDLFVSPEGTPLTLAQVEFLYGMPEEQRILEFPTLPQVFEPVAPAIPLETRIADIETQLAGELPGPERVFAEQQLASLKVQEALGIVFPEQAIADILEFYFPTVEDISAVPQVERVRVEAEIALRAERGQEFIAKIVAAGRTPETEAILLAIDPSLSDEQIEGIFTQPGDVFAEARIKNLDAVALARVEEEEFDILFGTKGERGSVEDWVIKNIFPKKGKDDTLVQAVTDEIVKLLTGVAPPPNLLETAQFSFVAGWGAVISTASGTAGWLGWGGIAENLSEIGADLQENRPPNTLGEFDLADLLNPEFYATKVVEVLPFALSLVPLAIGGFYAGASMATAVGLGTIWSWIVGGLTSAVLSRPVESALEAGSQYDDAIARGLSEKEARAEADKVFRENMLLIGADAFQIAIALAPTPKWVPSALVKRALVRTIIVAGKTIIVGLSEGGEEIFQDMIQRHARGEEWQLDPISKEVFAIGFIMGAGMGLGGGVIANIVTEAKVTMTPEQLADFEATITTSEGEGFTTEQAEAKALDVVAQTPEGGKVIGEAIETVKAKPEEVAEVTPIEEVPVEPVEPTPIPIPPTAEAFEARLQAELVREGFPQPTRVEVPEVKPIQFLAQRRAMEKTLATVERLHRETAAGEIITVSWKQVVSRGWHPDTGRVHMSTGGIVADRMSGLRGRFIGDKIRPIGQLRGQDADPWIYFTRGGKKYRTPLYTDPTMSGTGKLETRLAIPPAVEAVPPIPKAEPGMPEAGLQPSMIPEIPFKEVRPLGRGKMVQISMDDQLKLEQVRRAAEEAPEAAKEAYEAQGKIEGLQSIIESDPVAQYRFKLGGKNVGLESLISIREQTFPELFTVKQAQALNPEKAFTRYTEKGLETYNRVPRDVVLDDLTKEFGMTSDEIAERVMWIRGARQEIKNLESEITEQFTEKPLAARGEVTPEEAAENLAILGRPKLTLKQVDALTGVFAEYILNPNTVTAFELTRALRSEELAKRAESLKARAQEYVISGGVSVEEALKRAMTETLSGKLPSMRTEYLEGIVGELRDAHFAKVYYTFSKLDKRYQLEMASTITALTNALTGKAIPTKRGAGSILFPQGGSAWDRLNFVFNKTPKVLKAIRTIAKEKKPLPDIVDGVFRVPFQDPIPLDQKTVNYLRAVAKELRTPEDLAIIDIYFKEHPPQRLPPVEPPIKKGMKQMPMIPEPQKHIILRALKEVGLTVVDIGSFMRANMASFDFSFWRQQAPLILNNKRAFINANIYAWKSMWSQQALEASWIRITRDPLYQIYDEAGYDFLRPPPDIKTGIEHWKGIEEFGFVFGRQQRPIPRFTSKLPHVKLSARAFATGTNEHNWRIFKNHYNAMLQVEERIASGEIKLKPGEAFSIQKEMKDYARMLADFTGRASLGKIGPAAPALAALFFSPRLNLGRLLTPRHLVSSNPHVRKAAWMNLTTFVGGVGGIISLGAQLGLWEVEWDPRSPNFAQIRIGNVRFDPWGGFRPFVVFFARVLTKTGLSGATGKEYVVDPLASTAWFIRGKAAPLAAVMADFITGKTFLGDEVDVTNLKQQIERVAPFAARDLYEVYMEDPLLAIFAFVPAMLGAGIMAYSGDWEENWPKLGLPKYPENLPYGITEPVYNAKDFYSDTAKLFTGVDPETLTAAKGFPPYIKAIVEVARIKEALSLLPNQTLISINADITEGTTFLQYYQMWLDREKIVATGDKEALKAFDADKRTQNAHLGNMTQSQYALLVEYHSIIDAEKQAEFLEKHKDEIGINLRHAWLAARPKENAQLAVWGQAKILTLAAYKEVQSLLKELDIPANALPDFLLPPEGSLETHFTYEDFVAEGKHASWEAQLLLLNDAKVAEEAGVESYAEWHELTLSDTPVRALELKVEHRELSDEWNGYSDKDSPFYIDDKDLREEARDKLKTDNPEWVDDIRRIEAIENLASDKIIEEWVERGNIVDQFSAGSAEAKLWLIDHPETLTWALDQELLTDDGSDWNVPVLRIDVEWREWDDWYDEIEGTTVEGVTFTKAQVKAQALILYPEYATARIKRNGFSEGVPENLIDTWVEYYSLPLGEARTDFLKTHPEYYTVVWLGILENDPIKGARQIFIEEAE